MDLEQYTPEQLRTYLRDYSESLSELRQQVIQIRGERDRLRHECGRLEKEREAEQARRTDLEQLINVDPQTGLPIRRRFVSDCDAALAESMTEESFAVVGIMRLDGNYRRIRASRDRSNALVFRTTLRVQSVIGDHLYQSDRYDEFLFLLTRMSTVESVRAIAERIRAVVSQPHDPPAEDISFGCFIGMAIAGRDGRTQAELTDAATIAIDRAEEDGSPLVMYSEELGQDIRYRHDIEKELRRSLNEGFKGFALEYQPIARPDGTLVSAEVLTRLRSPTLGPVSPSRFIPIAEENGDIRVLGQWIIFNACRQLKRWHDEGFESFRLSINLSSLQFKQPDIVDRLEGVIRATKVPPSALKIELTETEIMDDPSAAITIMNRMREQGVSILIDDFGTGYSSLSYLRDFPADTLKIDKSFVDRVVYHESDRQIIRAIVSLARGLDMDVLAEGVENAEQLSFLKSLGVDLIQGYYFSAPVPEQGMYGMLQNGFVEPSGHTKSTHTDGIR